MQSRFHDFVQFENLYVPALLYQHQGAVEAAIHGDRQAALLLDPVVGSYENAVKMLEELLNLHQKYVHEGFGS